MRDANLTCIRDSQPPYRTLIYDQGGKLRIKVINMQEEAFVPLRAEAHLFGDNFGDILAFETIGYSGQSPEELEAAIRWYAVWIGCPEMKIYKENPL